MSGLRRPLRALACMGVQHLSMNRPTAMLHNDELFVYFLDFCLMCFRGIAKIQLTF